MKWPERENLQTESRLMVAWTDLLMSTRDLSGVVGIF